MHGSTFPATPDILPTLPPLPLQKEVHKQKADFDAWAADLGKGFKSDQDKQIAFQNFKRNMKQMIDVNVDTTSTYWSAVNEFFDMSPADFAAERLMKTPPPPPHTANPPVRSSRRGLLNTDVNWITAGKVPPIRNQGGCGSCWAFAATAAVSSRYAISTGQAPPVLSEQQIVSCVNSLNGFGSAGCNGGWVDEVSS
jgi:hypothetical protein